MLKKGGLYYPTKEFKKNTWLKSRRIYKEAEKSPVKFWEKLAEGLFWFEKWKKVFEHRPPYFKWFLGGKINITENIFKTNTRLRGQSHFGEAKARGWLKLKNKTAIIWEPEPITEQPRKITYQELFQEVNKLANGLKKLGVKKGDRIGIYLPMIPEVLISMLACVRLGAVHSVVFSAFSPAALRIRLQDTEAKILITADGYYRRGKVINLKEAADEAIQKPAFASTSTKVSASDKSTADKSADKEASAGAAKVEKVIVVKRAGNEVSWQGERDLWWSELIKGESDECRPEIMDSEDLLFVLYTSGSTGKPKGCEHVCGGYAVQAYWTGKWIFDLREGDIFWCTSDPGWITGHTYTIYSPLLNGITTLIFEGAPDWPTPERWAQIIEKYGVTIFYTAPTAIRMFIKEISSLKKYKFKTLRLLGSVGEPIDETAWLWYFNQVGKGRCPLVDTWWQTETGGILITSLPGVGPFKPAFTGLPFPGLKARILDEKGRTCPPGKSGNLVLLPPFAPGLLRGIYKDPKKYLETYWNQYGKKVYFTSDGAYRDKQGLIRILGRVDDAIKVAGHRLTTSELEAAINSHPEIAESAVIGIPDEIKGEVPSAFVVYRGKKTIEEVKQEVVNLIRKQIGPIALPKDVFVVDDLPKTRSGKIMRRILKRLWTGEDLGDLSTLSNPEIVEKIREILKK